jgi:hypothetical protein
MDCFAALAMTVVAIRIPPPGHPVFCNREPALSQPRWDLAREGSSRTGRTMPIKQADNAMDGTNTRFCSAAKTIKTAPANGQWQFGWLLCNGAADKLGGRTVRAP